MEVRRLVLSDVQSEIEQLVRSEMKSEGIGRKEAMIRVSHRYPELFQAKERMFQRPGAAFLFFFKDGQLVPALKAQTHFHKGESITA